jgi:hypothetical protein
VLFAAAAAANEHSSLSLHSSVTLLQAAVDRLVQAADLQGQAKASYELKISIKRAKMVRS